MPREEAPLPSTAPAGGLPERRQAANNLETSGSLARKIQNSASALIRETVSRPGTHGLIADLSQSLSSGSKAGSSHLQDRLAGPAASSTAGRLHTRTDSAAALAPDEAKRSVPESFRSILPRRGAFDLDPLTQEVFQNEYDLLSGNDGPVRLLDKGKRRVVEMEGMESLDSSDLNPAVSQDTSRSFHTAWDAASQLPVQMIQSASASAAHYIPTRQVEEDGAAVVSLLTDPSFQPEFLPSVDDPMDDAAPPLLTAAELRIIDSFRRSSSVIPAESRPLPLTSCSLIPDIDGFLAQDAVADITAPANATALRDRVLSSLPGAVDWMAVEENYCDEVWGYLQPALEAASGELMEKNHVQANYQTGGEDGPAVRRLKMILTHMLE